MMSIADTSTASRDERPADALSLSKQWNSNDWTKAERYIRHMQGRISKAYSEGRTSLAKRLSYLLVNSFYAKALAVRRVSEQNKGVRHESDKEECEKRKREVTMGFVPHRPHRGMRSE